MTKKHAVLSALLLTLAVGVAYGTDADVIGLSTLRAREPLLNGSGVTVAQVEATAVSGSSVYQPNPAGVSLDPVTFSFYDTDSPFPVAAGFSAAKESGHANSVAANLYGPTAPAPGVGAIRVFDANYFFNSIINSFSPVSIGAAIVNQSYIFGVQDTGIDQLYDNYADRFKILFINGVNNGPGTTPPSPATMYNGIAVGLVNGGGSTGPTATGGRAKPDLVAPSSFTSFATPYVSGAAAILIQAGNRADGGNGTESAAVDPRTVKALLLNGATKPVGWTRVGREPLDRNSGAGILNVDSSHRQLAGGRQAVMATANFTTSTLPPSGVTGNATSLLGWNLATIQNVRITGSFRDAGQHYYFDLPSSQSGAFSATCTLVWNRQDGQSGINNLDLRLFAAGNNTLVATSNSTVDNVEHFSITNLPPGRYALQVLKPASALTTETYALAFQFSALPPPVAPSGLTASSTAAGVVLGWTDNASDESGYRILRSTSADSGFIELAMTAASAVTFTDSTAAAGTRYYYRVSAFSQAGESSFAAANVMTRTELEAWREQYFSTTENAGSAADAFDADGDGLPNLVEYALGSLPLSPASAPMPAASLETSGGSTYLTLTVDRTALRPDVSYVVQVGDDLVGWSSDVTVLENTATRLKVRDNVPLTSGGKRFIRLQVTTP